MEIGYRLKREDWYEFRRLRDELEYRKYCVVQMKPGKSIVVWLPCLSYESMQELQWMMKDGSLRNDLEKLFSCILKSDQCETAELGENPKIYFRNLYNTFMI